MRPGRVTLLVGAEGCLGHAVIAAAAGEDGLTATSREDSGPYYVNLETPPGSWRLPDPGPGGAALILAALTDTAACEADPARARRLNLEATLTLARLLAGRGFFVVFPSTSQVFDGSAPMPAPGDPTNPVTVYGGLKAETEAALLRELPGGAAVLRITKVLDGGNGLIRRWTSDLLAGQPVEAFEDMRMAPVSEAEAARALLGAARDRAPGVFHLSAARDITYFEAARIGAEALGADPALVRPVSCAGRGLFAPAHTALAMSGPAPAPEVVVRRAFELAAEASREARP
ncbi:sugar nucleotide-binding protein [Desulfovibrio aminophilus]|nr:sugar nucleotide-binding protein [Desulfovibrio aminophilus]MCM0754516.1 sugar nucleotide-binding protein [Desulfovibrio aminophilus]